ncbi:LamG domain-containing protein [Pendulispora rubella]|uniref:LamG domain-containing protein n=1 Tax=Pendulispora rubella TaxID=2741070 RepID=A0ABZ2LAF1_9BACT
MVAVPWLVVQITGCSFLADLELPEGGDSPGGGDGAGPPVKDEPPPDGGGPSFDASDPDVRETGTVSDASTDRNDAKVPPPPPKYANEVMADQPSAYWRLGDGSGTSAKDSAGSHPGTYQQGFTLGGNGVVSNDTAVRFDGQSGRIRLGDIFDFSNNVSCTLEAWVQWSGGGTGNIFSKRASDRGGTGYALFVSGVDGGRFRWTYLRQNGDRGTSVTFDTAAKTAFVHVVATYDGNIGRLYLDGAEVQTSEFRDSLVGGQSELYLGNNASGDGGFSGMLDELAIYEHVVSANRIQAHYKAADSK